MLNTDFEIAKSATIKVDTACGNLYTTVCFIEGRAVLVRITLGKAGGCERAQMESVAGLFSVGLRHNVPVGELIAEIRGVHCPKPHGFGENKVFSCVDAAARCIQKIIDTEAGNGKETA